ncbi:MAG: ABC transporter permease [Actinomycetota bacterium]
MTAGPAARAAARMRPGTGLVRWLAAIGAGLAGFALFVAIAGGSPAAALQAIWSSTVVDAVGPGEVLVAAAPVILCALAVAIPAWAGLWNLGGEGQLVVGAIGATVVSQALPSSLGSWAALPLLLAGGAIGGALWCAIPAVLRVTVNLNEAISSLLLSYVALRLLDYLVNGPWKDPRSLGFPQAEPLPDGHRLGGLDWLPVAGGGRLHTGLLIALAAVAAAVVAHRHTTWGFRLRVVGGNGEAARRGGLPVKRLIVGAMVAGGALAGVAGMVQLSGVEFQAKGGIAGAYGFLGFLVSWLVRHDPRWIVLAGIAIGAVRVGGDALQIDANLPAASVNVLLALLLLAILARGRGRRRSA